MWHFRHGKVLQRWQHPDWLSNTWLLAAGDAAAVIDPAVEVGTILTALRELGSRLDCIILTHHHLDHSRSAPDLHRQTGARMIAHVRELPLIEAEIGIPSHRMIGVEDGEEIRIGEATGTAMHIPGHTAGQLALHLAEVGVFTGDTLFSGSIGSTVAPGHTDFPDLRRSLTERLMSLPDDTPVLPGHSLPTMIGLERESNPFLLAMRESGDEAKSGRGLEAVTYAGRPARLIVWAVDYDGGHKAWIRFTDNQEDAVVPGSRVRRVAER